MIRIFATGGPTPSPNRILSSQKVSHGATTEFLLCYVQYLFLGSITTLTIMNFNHRQIKRDKTTLLGLFDIFIINLERSGSVGEVSASWQHCSTSSVADPVCLSRFIPAPNFFRPNPGSRAKKIPGSRIRIRIKEFKFYPKNCFYALGNDPRCLYGRSHHHGWRQQCRQVGCVA